MKERLGFVAFALGMITLTGVAGAVTDLPPEATVTQWITLFGLGATGGLLSQFGLWMVLDQV